MWAQASVINLRCPGQGPGCGFPNFLGTVRSASGANCIPCQNLSTTELVDTKPMYPASCLPLGVQATIPGVSGNRQEKPEKSRPMAPFWAYGFSGVTYFAGSQAPSNQDAIIPDQPLPGYGQGEKSALWKQDFLAACLGPMMISTQPLWAVLEIMAPFWNPRTYHMTGPLEKCLRFRTVPSALVRRSSALADSANPFDRVRLELEPHSKDSKGFARLRIQVRQ